MINKLNKAKIALRKNSGSGVVSVLIAMMFLTILGVMMLCMTYTGLVMKVTEREGTDNFYEAEAAMNIIKAEVQAMVSDTISVAYHEVMSNYSDDAEATFQTAFVENIYEYEYTYTVPSADGSSSIETTIGVFPEITSSYGGTGSNEPNYYDANVFAAMITQAASNALAQDGTVSSLENVTVTVAEESQYSGSTSNGMILVSDDGSQVSFKGICVTYTNPDTGYATTIQTDIVCKAPEFYTSSLGYSITTIPNFALIANGDINTVAAAVELEIEGNAYGGSLTLGSGATNTTSQNESLTISDGTLIIAGDTTISNRSTFTIGEDATLWTQNIILDGGSSTTGTNDDGTTTTVSSLVELMGTVYVADDMELNGDYAMVEVPEGSDGAYYGFGNSDASADGSSAILINGKYTQLNLAGISDLMLAGYSFIDTASSSTTNAGVLMGESVSVKSNQLLYLAPVGVLQTTDGGTVNGNPVINSSDTVSTEPTSNWANGVEIPEGTEILTLRYTVGNDYADYYYLKFATTADANQYFIDYFTMNSDAIEDYISLYTDGIQLPDGGVMSGSALEVTKDGDELITSLVEPADNTSVAQMLLDAEVMSEAFTKLCRTLSTTLTSSDVDMTPYNYVVETETVNTFFNSTSGTVFEFEDADGNVVAKLIEGDYIVGGVSGTADEPAIILATGDITVNVVSYKGLMVAGGEMTLSNTCESITADKDAVSSAFQGIYTINNLDGSTTEVPFYTFLNEDVVGSTDSSTQAETYTWDLDELVVYDEWKRS